MFALSHECTHFTPFRSRWLSSVCGHAVGVLLLLPFTWFRLFHIAHHQHTNDPARDPELEGGPRPRDPWSWLAYLSGWGYWRYMAATVLSSALGSGSEGLDGVPYLPRRHHATLRREARCYLAVYALALLAAARHTSAAVVLWRCWALPLLVGQPFLRAFLLAEHGLCPAVGNMLENSRTTTAGGLVNFLAWNMPFHAEHHAW
jgi:fatty acid desaturase